MQVLDAADLHSTSLPLMRNAGQYTDPEVSELIDLMVFCEVFITYEVINCDLYNFSLAIIAGMPTS